MKYNNSYINVKNMYNNTNDYNMYDEEDYGFDNTYFKQPMKSKRPKKSQWK